MNDNIFVGVFPAGIAYSDRQQEEHRDYKRLAFLPYATLELQLKDDCPDHLARDIESHAAIIQMRRGLRLQTSECGGSVLLGEDLPVNTPHTVAEARALLATSLRDGEHEIEGTYPYRNSLNDRSRLLIQSYRNDHGTAWLGRVNLYKEQEGQPIIWECADAEVAEVYGASFVLPAYDAELERMIVERDRTPYTGTADDSKLVGAIFERIEQLGGHVLFWN
jgi:hypothetical protein